MAVQSKQWNKIVFLLWSTVLNWKAQHLSLVTIFTFRGILHQKNFYRLNLIFWIVMGCGIARFGRRGLKTTETWKFWSQNLSPGVLRRGAPGVSRHSAMGFRGAAPLIKDFSDLSFGAVPRGPIWFRWFLGLCDQNELYHTPLLYKIWDLGDRNFFGGGSL